MKVVGFFALACLQQSGLPCTHDSGGMAGCHGTKPPRTIGGWRDSVPDQLAVRVEFGVQAFLLLLGDVATVCLRGGALLLRYRTIVEAQGMCLTMGQITFMDLPGDAVILALRAVKHLIAAGVVFRKMAVVVVTLRCDGRHGNGKGDESDQEQAGAANGMVHDDLP